MTVAEREIEQQRLCWLAIKAAREAVKAETQAVDDVTAAGIWRTIQVRKPMRVIGCSCKLCASVDPAAKTRRTKIAAKGRRVA